MKKLIETIRNIFSIEELRRRIMYTLLLLVVFRLGCYIVLPGIEPSLLQKGTSSGLFGLFDTFLGGAFTKSAIFALGIMPYISASIIVQLLQVALPSFQKMQQDDSGRKQLTQVTRYLTIVITLAQSFGYLTTQVPKEAILVNYNFFIFSSMIILTGGTMFTMWLGERITDKGLGNGTSMLIMIGIVSRFPIALIKEASLKSDFILVFIIEVAVLFFVVMGVVLITQAVRKIPIQYARQVVGGKITSGQRQYLPLKLNSAGVMPIIFAQSLVFLPGLIARAFPDNNIALWIAINFDQNTVGNTILTAVLIIIFTYFYTAIQVDPVKISEDIKRNNGFIPGVKPGPQTSEHIDDVLSKITLPGALFLAVIAILPIFAQALGIGSEFASFYGGTSLLILVGVVLDTLQQINSYLLMKRYEGLMQSGKVKGQSQDMAIA
jgi:preprotein translocase subunit SecY